MTGHLARARQRRFGRDLLELVRLDVVLSLMLTTLVMGASFVIVPNILYNLGYPRARLADVRERLLAARATLAARASGGCVRPHGRQPQ